jgi:integrase/recombinase XerD
MSSVSVVFRKDKLNSKNEAPIHFRIIKNRKVSYIASGNMLNIDYWDFKKNCVKTKYKNSARLNSYLIGKLSELQDNVLEIEKSSKSLSSKRLKEKIYGKTTNFFEFAEGVIEQYKIQGNASAYDRSRTVLKKLKDYVGNNSLQFTDIDQSFLNKYENYLRSKFNNSTNTIHHNLKFIRKLFNDAVRLDLVEINSSPFLKYRIKQEKTSRQYLNEEELKLIEDFIVTHGTRLELHRDMFVFSAYAGGLRVSDVLRLKWKNFDGKHLNLSIKKTGEQLSIKLPQKSLDIINKYYAIDKKPEHFIFPMLKNDLDTSNPFLLDKAITSATAYINKNLKFIGNEINLTKPISFHISRHTWATRALRKGISLDKVSKLMGHAHLKETQIYAKIVSEELDKAMDVFNDK